MIKTIRQRPYYLVRLCSAAVWVTVLVVFAMDAANAAEANAAIPVVTSGSVVRVFLGLFAVLGAIVLLSFMLKKLNMVPGRATAAIRPISSLSLNSRDKLMLIEVGEEQLLVGVSPGRISKIHKLSSPVVADPEPAPETGGKPGFANILSSALTGQKS